MDSAILLQQHLEQLIAYPSLTPNDAGCQKYLQSYLKNLNFNCQSWQVGKVHNLYAEFGTEGPLFVFAGHTDVVDAGPESQWQSPPFQLNIEQDIWTGRGMVDMKGAIAAMLVAIEWRLKINPTLKGRFGFLITSAEEGDDFMDGTPFILEQLQAQGKKIQYCIVGEPSSVKTTGDTIKNGRRGSLNGQCIIHGIQGHVAYPHLAKNAIHLALPFLTSLSQKVWDVGDDFFSPTQLQITRLDNKTNARNVVPGCLEVDFNLRFNNQHTAASIQEQILAMAIAYGLDATWTWQLSGKPFVTKPGHFLEICQNSIEKINQKRAELSTSGGTSDARFIAPYGIDVIELGLPNATMHQINERTSRQELQKLTDIYFEICQQVLS
ncbi:MAG: succinyl-diaminopimelate desuccinylase [Gammaproteobacteria bacterium]|nr:succinyl-diaminopimelate desuccinylase [Gammaproteobacteria bacterium]